MMCASLVVVRKKTIIKVHVIRTNKTKEKKEKRSVCDSQNRDKRKGATIIINAERKKEVARREQSKDGGLFAPFLVVDKVLSFLPDDVDVENLNTGRL